MKKKTVYIVNKGGHDFTDADRFGELDFMSEGLLGKYDIGVLYRKFATLLRNSSENDYLLTTGLPLANCIACAIFARIHGKLNLLLFRDGKYIERTVIIDSLL